MSKLRLIERFSGAPDPEGWFRILPVGMFARFGRKVNITPQIVREMAANFGRVPETGVPVTRAHNDTAGKVGDVTEVEARPDGLWGRIRWTLEGARLLAEGAFRYLSPEIVWGPTDYDGHAVRNVLTGLSLVNRPFFGRPVGLFWLRPQKQPYAHTQSYKDQQKESTYMEETVQEQAPQAPPAPQPQQIPPSQPLGLLGRLVSWLVAKLAEWLWPKGSEGPAPADELAEAEALHALMRRFGELEVAGLGQGWSNRLARVARFDTALADDIATQFRALLTQRAQAALFNEIGASGNQAVGPVERFNAAVKAAMHTYGLDYAAAGKKIAAERPELYSEYQSAVTNRL